MRLLLIFGVIFVLVSQLHHACPDNPEDEYSIELVDVDEDAYIDQEYRNFTEVDQNLTCAKMELSQAKRKRRKGKKVVSRPKGKRVVRQSTKCRCGRKAADQSKRIVNGQSATKNEYPWMAALLDATTEQQFCGGSLVNNLYVVTAAHCLKGMKVSQVKVHFGDFQLSAPDETKHVVRKAKLLMLHPEYNAGNSNNDIGMVKVESKVPFNRFISPICLPPTRANYNGWVCTVTGWGYVNEGGPASDVLREVRVKTMSNLRCQQQYKKGDTKIFPGMLCAKAAGKDACQGDSGGPLICRDRVSNHYVLVGVVSFGIGCAKSFPGVYARVQHYKGFIKKNTQDGIFCVGGNLKV